MSDRVPRYNSLVPDGTTFAVPAAKCCADCALRRRSRERSDPWEWLMRAESWAEGGIHICHKTIPGHPGFDPQCGRPNYQHCAGHRAMSGKPVDVWMKHTMTDALARAEDSHV